MTVTNTSLLGLALPTTGTESGVWGDDVNNGLTILIDVSVAGTNNITQDSDITLAVSNGNNSSSFTSTATNSAVAQYYVLNCSGARTALRNIIVPTTSKTYVVTNGTTGGFGITVKKSGGTGVTVAAGETAIVFYNTVTGDVAKVTSTVNVSSFSAGTTGLTPNTATTGALATTNGGTGLTSFTSGGVVYASSTSALATGSALTFDGTNLSLLPSGYSVFGASSAEQMRLTSTGLGIGTSSPAQKLHVAGRIAVSGTNPSIQQTVQNAYLDLCGGTTVGTDPSIQIAGSTTTSDANKIFYNSNTHVFRSSSGGTTYSIIDSSGNLGLGVTPSAWAGTAGKAMQINSLTMGQNIGFDVSVLTTNGYATSGSTYNYIGSASAGQYQFGGGGHRWYTAPSGTAGNTITFSQAMTLDASGNLLVGVTSGTSYKLNIKTSSASSSAIGTSGTSGDTTFQAILISKFDNDSTTSQNFIQFQINNGGANCGKITANGANTAAFGSTSDQRVKENIVELPSQLDNIMALRPVEFDYLESYGGGHQIGFIAQEIQQVYPDVISTDDSSEKIMSIAGWSKTEARLVKAIQEQQAIITQLTARITALELA